MKLPRQEDRNKISSLSHTDKPLKISSAVPGSPASGYFRKFALATCVQVFYGAPSINLSEVVQAGIVLSLRPEFQGNFQVGRLADVFHFIFSTYPKENNWIQEKVILRRMRVPPRQDRNLSFIKILGVGRRFLATNPLDYIYAFLGHPTAKPRNRSLSTLKPDYGLDIEEPSRQLIKWLYEEEHRINFLYNISYSITSELEHSTSWLPTFHRGQIYPNIDNFAWKADNSLRTNQLVKAIFQDHMLQGVGVIFDSITACSEVNWQQTPQPQGNVVELCWKLQAGCTQITDMEERLIQFYCTLVGGTYTRGAAHLQWDFESYFRKKFLHKCAQLWNCRKQELILLLQMMVIGLPSSLRCTNVYLEENYSLQNMYYRVSCLYRKIWQSVFSTERRTGSHLL